MSVEVGLKHACWLDLFYYPKEIKEIKEILLLSLCAALSVLSAISAGRLLSHADSVLLSRFLLSRFLLSRRNKGNSRNYSYRPPRSSFCSFCGTLLSHAHSIFCPAVIGFAASLVEEIKEIKEIFVPTREAFLLFLLFLRDIIISCGADSILLSHGHRLCRFARRRNEGNKGNLLAHSAKPFLLFLPFLRDIIISCG